MIKSKKLKHEQTLVDPDTGEITTTSKTYNVKVNYDEFYMVYIENMASFFNLKSLVEIKVLTKFCMIADFNTGRVLLPAGLRIELLKFLGISSQQLTNAIKHLKENELLDGEKGTYYINPMVFWKGSNDTRNELLKTGKLVVNVEFGGQL
jgi:hypothetical protein